MLINQEKRPKRSSKKRRSPLLHTHQQAGSQGERIVVCLAWRRKAVHLQQHAHEDHWEPDEYRHGTFLIQQGRTGTSQTGLYAARVLTTSQHGCGRLETKTSYAVQPPEPAR